ncbi:MAG: YfiR family protein [Bacteroidetes bacterium]|nr:YfiR family protein [Bacteroidota bacterium]
MKTIKAVVAAAVMLASSFVNAQEARPMHEVYSMMVFNFVKYVQWPTNDSNKEFVIGVVGNNDIYNTLNTWYSGKPKGNKTYVIKKFNSAAEVTDCQVVFIDRSKSNEFDAVNTKVKGKGTLVVTDRNGLGTKGSCINFKTVDEKLKFELNQSAIEASNLKVSSTLASMAILI